MQLFTVIRWTRLAKGSRLKMTPPFFSFLTHISPLIHFTMQPHKHLQRYIWLGGKAWNKLCGWETSENCLWQWEKSPVRTWSERTCILLRIFAMTSMTGSCSQLGLLEGLSCRKCNSVSCWPSQLRNQRVTLLLSQQRWTLCELLAGKGLMREGKGSLPLPVICIFIQFCIFPTCFMIHSVVPRTACM